MIRLFADTEFTDFSNTKLISLGVVSECGNHEYYLEIFDYDRSLSSQFVKEHIEPLLNHKHLPSYRCIPKDYAGNDFARWLCNLPMVGDKMNQYQICVDYPTDWELIVDLLEAEIPPNIAESPSMLYTDLQLDAVLRCTQVPPLHVNKLLREYRKVFNDAFDDHFQKNPTIGYHIHHALYDARANREAFIKTLKYIEAFDEINPLWIK